MHRVAIHRCATSLLAIGLTLGAYGAARADDTQWAYKSFRKSATGGYSKDAFVEGALSITKRDDKWFMDMTAGGNNTGPCYRTPIEADVMRTDDTTTIEPKLLSGCDVYRYVIRNDGTGGQRQVKKGDKWISDGYDHNLKAIR